MEVIIITERTDWHDIFQGMLEDTENLRELSGKIIVGKAREYYQLIRSDFLCHTEGDISSKDLKPIVRPFSHFKKRNLVEYKSTWESLNEKIFRRYVGRALDAETCDDTDYQNETTLTILTLHKPISLIADKEYKIERVTDWKYRSYCFKDLDVFIAVQREMRGLKGGEAMALLQVIESEKDKQKQSWRTIFEQDLDNKDVLEKIAEQISKEQIMSLVEEMKKEGRIEGKKERSTEIAIEMLKDGMDIKQIVKFTKLPEAEVLKLKKQIEAEK